jgi:Flp pilus assembly pilin Flp
MQRLLPAVGKLFVRLARDERGAESTEYAITLGLLSVGVYALVVSVGDKVLAMWQKIDAALAAIG